MEKIIMEIVKYLYGKDKKQVLNYWEKLNSILLEEKIDETNFMHILQFFVLAKTIGACLGKDTEKLKEKISACIQYILPNPKYQKKLKELLIKSSIDDECNPKKETDAFKILAETASCDDTEHYSFALYNLTRLIYSCNDEYCIFNLAPVLWSIISFAAWYTQSTNRLEIQIGDYILGFFYEFCEQETLSKRYFYTDKDVIETRLKDLQQRDPKTFSIIMRNHHFNEVYDWIHLYYLFDANKRSDTLLRLFEKVFLNKSVIIELSDWDNDQIDYFNNLMPEGKKIINYYSDHAYESAPQLFDQVRNNIQNLEQHPGFVIMLYMLCKEFSLDQFYLVFPDRKSPEINNLEVYEWNLIPEILSIHDVNKGKDKDYDELFELYENDLRALHSEVSKDFGIIDGKQYKRYVNNNELLNMLLFFCVWENVSYCMKDNGNFTGDIKAVHKTQVLINPFFDACSLNTWREKETIEEIFNNIAEVFCFENQTHTFDNFKINTEKSNVSLLMLLYNLSRTEVEAQSAMKDQINYLREIQRKKLPLERYKSNLDEAKKNQEKICLIDKGFKLNNFISQIFPFCGVEFQRYFPNQDMFMLRRDYICKFICETDTVYDKDKEFVTDYRETNRIGFKTRYLYKDRNMSTHHVRHASVDNLMKTSNWKNLLYAFCDIEKNLCDLLEEKERNYYKHPLTSPKPKRNPQTFIIYYLFQENKRLYNEFISKLHKAAGLVQIVSEFRLYEHDSDLNDFRDNSENIIKKIESTFNLTDEKSIKKANEDFAKKLSYAPEKLHCSSFDSFQQRENLFEIRLERLLNIMFAANGSNENGFEHNLTMFDFFKRYHAEIAVYLIYLTGEFSKL